MSTLRKRGMTRPLIATLFMMLGPLSCRSGQMPPSSSLSPARRATKQVDSANIRTVLNGSLDPATLTGNQTPPTQHHHNHGNGAAPASSAAGSMVDEPTRINAPDKGAHEGHTP